MPIVIGAGNIHIGWNFDFSIIQRTGCTCTQERNSDGMNRRSQSTRRWVPSNTQVAKNFEYWIFGINPRIAHRYYWLLFIVILGGHHPWLHKSLHRHSFSEQGSCGQEIKPDLIHLDHDHHRHHNQGAECARPYDRYDGRFELGHLIYGLGAGHTRLDDVPRDRTLFDWYVSSGYSRKEVWPSHSQYSDQSDS